MLGLFALEDLVLAGVNSERCDPLLDPELGAQVTYLTEDFYTQDGFLCLIPERLTLTVGSDTYPADYLIAPAALGESAQGFGAVIALH